MTNQKKTFEDILPIPTEESLSEPHLERGDIEIKIRTATIAEIKKLQIKEKLGEITPEEEELLAQYTNSLPNRTLYNVRDSKS